MKTNSHDLVYDPSDEATRRNPYPLFESLRELDPVHWSEPMGSWIVTDFDLATEVLTMNTYYSAERLGSVVNHLPSKARPCAEQILQWLTHWMVFKDQPDHTRLRRHMARVLNAAVFATLHDSINDICTMLLDQLPRGETFDFVKDFSILLPGMVVMDFFGVPRERLLEVKGWSDDMMLFIGSARGVENKYERARRGALAMGTLFQDMIKDRRKNPQNDVLTRLILSDINGDTMSDDEIVGSMMMVLNGGHETTANLLNNAIMALSHFPEQMTALRQDLSRMPAAVEELLRYDSPVMSLGRVVKQAVQLGDKTLMAGERVFAMLVAANRDPKVFVNPNQLILTRDPNPHMAFGKGPHHCMGMPLARDEGAIVITQLLERFGRFELMEDMKTVPWMNSMVTRGPIRLPVRFS